MAAPKKQVINLLPQEEFAASTTGRVLAWILSTFRVIVVITEMVVMAAFLSRFYLDSRITNLNDEIRTTQSTVKAFESFEKDFRSAQFKLSITKSLINQQPNILSYLSNLSSHTPDEIKFQNFNYAEKKLTVKALSPSEISIAQLFANLKQNDTFSGIQLSQLNSSEADQILNFTFDMETKK